jgi:hypothetical protein
MMKDRPTRLLKNRFSSSERAAVGGGGKSEMVGK